MSYLPHMSRLHKTVAVLSIFGALAILLAMLFGWNVSLEKSLGVKKSLRDVAVALWAFVLPAFFVLEEVWFAPKDDPAALQKFSEDQRKARLTWIIVGGVFAVLIGSTAPDIQATTAGATGPNPNTALPPR